jgi:hypothetical protein
MAIEIPIRRVVRVLTAAVAAFSVAYVATRCAVFIWGIRPNMYPLVLFDLNGEGNFPALFQGSEHLTCAALLAVIAGAETARHGAARGRPWQGLACIFAFLSLDEWLGFHERLTHIFRYFHMNHGIFYFAWTIPYGLLVIFLAFVYLRWLLALPSRSRALFIASAVVFLSGAVGCEMLSGPIVEKWGRDSLPFAVEVLFEETLEAAGLTLYIYSLLDYWRTVHPGHRVTLSVAK